MEKNKKVVAYLSNFTLEIEGDLKISDREVNQIVMREPVMEDIQKVSKIEDELENNATLIGRLAGYTKEEILGLPVHIFQELIEGLESFNLSKENQS